MHACIIFAFFALLLNAGVVLETEGHDRSDINLPGNQLQLLQDATSSVDSEFSLCDLTSQAW